MARINAISEVISISILWSSLQLSPFLATSHFAKARSSAVLPYGDRMARPSSITRHHPPVPDRLRADKQFLKVSSQFLKVSSLESP
jgi:hypothetical protein